MDSFNFGRIRDLIPKEFPQWSSSQQSTNANGESDSTSTLTSLSQLEPPMVSSGPKSNLDLINECDNFPYYQTKPRLFLAHISFYYGLYVADHPDVELGYMLPSVAQVFSGLPDWRINHEDRSLTLVTGHTEEERSRAVASTTAAMRATSHFQVLDGWRDELYPVFGPKQELLFSVERSASPLFGVVTYGVHLTGYTKGSDEHEMKIWVPRRAATKQTYASMLDNTVGGGIAVGETPFNSVIREASEEASLDEAFVRAHVKPVGTVTYFHIRDARAGGESGLLQPECQYVYDLELPDGMEPRPCDGEVESFELMTVDRVKQALRDGEFKPNCSLVILDFFVRHGLITADDQGYVEIIARLHRILGFPTR